MKFWISVFVIILAFNNTVFSQLDPDKLGNAPQLLCVKNETSNQITIQWKAPNNIGACFEEYGVYVSSNNRFGPYVKVASILQPSDGIHTFQPPSNGISYVYMVNEQSCNTGNASVITSDTLDNVVPQAAPLITLVTVENGFPAIYWQPSANPEVMEYAIYSSMDNFSTPIDTVKGRLSNKFVDLSHDANQSAGAYRIRSLEYCEDPKGLYSNISERYNTIFLSNSDEDVCKRSVILDWNGYNYHTQRVDRYRIERAVNGADFELKEYVSDSVRKYEFVGLTPYAKNCIRIVAELPNGEESVSNIICLTSTSVPEVEDHYIENFTVKGSEVHITYVPDPYVTLSDIALERSIDGNYFNVLSSAVSINFDQVNSKYQIIDYSPLTNRTAYYYKVSVKNSCNNKYSTLAAKTILIKGENLGLSNEVTWDAAIVEDDEILSYDLFRIDGADTVLIHTQNSDGTFSDQNVYTNNFFAELCYIVRATHRTTHPDRPSESRYTYSNPTCLKPLPQAFVPNAFAPNGHNKIFKPILVFGTDENYSMTIYDRNGKKVFESNKPQIGWDGSNAQNKMALDSYVYHLQFTGMDGQSYRKTGFVVVVQ